MTEGVAKFVHVVLLLAFESVSMFVLLFSRFIKSARRHCINGVGDGDDYCDRRGLDIKESSRSTTYLHLLLPCELEELGNP